MTIKKEYRFLIGIIVVLLILFVITGRRSKMRYRVPDLDQIDRESITAIEITHSGEQILLARSQSGWTIMPQEYKADPDKVSSMLDVIAGLTLTELAAEKKDDQRYELDEEKRIEVKALTDGKTVREFDIGKVSSTYRHTFVKVGDDSRIFHARDSFRSTFDLDRAGLRDKSVMTFDKNEITQVSLFLEQGSYSFTKKMLPPESLPADPGLEEEEQPEPPEPQEAWVAQDGVKAKKTEIDSILNRLSDLDCENFIEEKTKDDFAEPICTVILTGNKEYSLRIFAKDEEADKYPALSSENPYPFLLSTWKAESVIKKPEDLLEKKEGDQ